MELPGWGPEDWVKPGSCLAEVCGLECHVCGGLESLFNLAQKHEMVTTISVEVFPGVLQTEQKYIGKWREAIETEMNIRHSES